jgi:RNA polymerase sigma-70 factor, ECF subfamily
MNLMLPSQTMEADLLARALALDNDALGEIHDRYFPQIYRYAYLRVEDEQTAKDIASEAFVRLLDALHGGRPPHTTLRGWLFGVASHLVMDQYHHRNSEPLSDYLSDGHSVQAEAEERLRQADVVAAMTKLTAEQREVLALRFTSGFSIEETAQMMQRSVTAVKGLQFRAVDALRQLLGEVENE